jgi:tetratricopeptide (TPR) repeat protein
MQDIRTYFAVIDAIDRFCKEAGIEKQDFACAMDLKASELTPGRMRDPGRRDSICRRLVWRLRREALPQVCVNLKLSSTDFKRLENLSASICSLLIDPTNLSDQQQAINAGEIGQALFEGLSWEVALAHLETFWIYVSQHPPNLNDKHLPIALHAGGSLASLYLHQARIDDAVTIVKSLQSIAPNYSGADADVLKGLAAFNGNAAMVARHQGLMHPQGIIGRHRKAYELAKTGGDHLRMITNLRDQAKPCASCAIERQGDTMARRYEEEMLHVLRESELLAGGDQPESGLEDQWLLTRLARIECLTAIERYDEARRTWDDTLKSKWVEQQIDLNRQTPVAAKAAFTKAAVAFCEHDLDKLVAISRGARFHLNHGRYTDRIQRLVQIENYAVSGEEQELLKALVR